MWSSNFFTLIFFVLCFECPLLSLNVAAEPGDELTSSLLSRASQWDCTSDNDCTVSNSSCTDGYCECEGGYIYNTDYTACLVAATAYGDECTETIQCSTFLLSGSTCSDGVCTCSEGYHYVRGRCHVSVGLGEACTADVNCYVWSDNDAASCVDGVCACSDGFYAREYRTCRRASYAVGDECAIDLDCQFENGYCDTSSLNAYSYVCASSETNDTTTRYSDGDVYEVEDILVRSLTRADENATIGTECVSDDNCTTLENSKCGAAGYCICNRAYFASDDLTYCIPEIGEDCDSDDDVLINYSLCRNGTWSCANATVTSINQKICRKTTKTYNWSCLYDEQCFIFGPDASCQSKRCLCDEGSHLVEDLSFCWVSKGISESCQADEDCYVADLDVELSCTNSVCTCPNGTSPNTDNTQCKDDDAVLGEVCEEDSDCTPANSACIDSICGCPDNYYIVDDYCAAGYNATCTSDSDCAVTDSTCTDDGLCGCIENYVVNSTDSCLPVVSYGEECESDVQCSATLSNTYCAMVTSDDDSNSTSTCQCESEYHYRFDICYAKTVIGGSCTSLGDCYVESGIEDVVCRKGVCACSWDSSADSTSCTRTSDATTLHLSTLLSLLLFGVKIILVQ